MKPVEIDNLVQKKLMKTNDQITLYGKNDTYVFSVNQRTRNGNMSKVYKGQRTKTGQPVAIKVLYQDLAEIPMFMMRFVNDVKSVIRISSPNIIHYYDYIEQNESHHIIMEWIDGETLEEKIERNKKAGVTFEKKEALQVIKQILQGLEGIHSWPPPIIHRDIKPGNIMVNKEGLVKVIDFGIAKFGSTTTNDDDLKLTGVATFLGTLVYASPEQVRMEHDEVGPHSDIWAVGLTLYEMLTNRIAFEAPTEEEVRRKIKHEQIPKPEYLDEEVYKLIRKATEKNVKNRYPSARAFIEDINKVLTNRPIRKSIAIPKLTPGQISLGVSVLIVFIFFLIFLLS